jgi:hypothetical protein
MSFHGHLAFAAPPGSFLRVFGCRRHPKSSRKTATQHENWESERIDTHLIVSYQVGELFERLRPDGWLLYDTGLQNSLDNKAEEAWEKPRLRHDETKDR